MLAYCNTLPFQGARLPTHALFWYIKTWLLLLGLSPFLLIWSPNKPCAIDIPKTSSSNFSGHHWAHTNAWKNGWANGTSSPSITLKQLLTALSWRSTVLFRCCMLPISFSPAISWTANLVNRRVCFAIEIKKQQACSQGLALTYILGCVSNPKMLPTFFQSSISAGFVFNSRYLVSCDDDVLWGCCKREIISSSTERLQ